MPSNTPPATSEQDRQFLRSPRELVRGVFRTSERVAAFGIAEGLGASIKTALPIAAGPVSVPLQPTVEGSSAQDASSAKGWKTDLRSIGRRFVPIAEVGASVAEGVPVFGAPVKAALEALVKVLNLIEQKCQNVEGINQLLQKLGDLEDQLKTCAESENTKRLISQLVDTEKELTQLIKQNILDSAKIAEAIAQCEKDISFFLQRFSVFGHTETQALVTKGNADLKETFVGFQEEFFRRQDSIVRSNQRQRELGEQSLIFLDSATTIGTQPRDKWITVIDPFGIPQKFSHIPRTYAEFGRMVLYGGRRNPKMQRTLSLFVEANLFELSVDDGHRIHPLGNHDLRSLGDDTKIVMSAVTFGVRISGRVKCPLCKNRVQLQGADGARVLCMTCDRSVQVSQSNQDGDSDEDTGATRPSVTRDEVEYLNHIVVRAIDSTHTQYMDVGGSLNSYLNHYDDIETINVYNEIYGNYNGVIEMYGGVESSNWCDEIQGTYRRDDLVCDDDQGELPPAYPMAKLRPEEKPQGSAVDDDVEYGTHNEHQTIGGDFNGLITHHGRVKSYNVYNVIHGDFNGVANQYNGTVYKPVHYHARDMPTPHRRDTSSEQEWEGGSYNISRTIRGDYNAVITHYGRVESYNIYNKVLGDYRGVYHSYNADFYLGGPPAPPPPAAGMPPPRDYPQRPPAPSAPGPGYGPPRPPSRFSPPRGGPGMEIPSGRTFAPPQPPPRPPHSFDSFVNRPRHEPDAHRPGFGMGEKPPRRSPLPLRQHFPYHPDEGPLPSAQRPQRRERRHSWEGELRQETSDSGSDPPSPSIPPPDDDEVPRAGFGNSFNPFERPGSAPPDNFHEGPPPPRFNPWARAQSPPPPRMGRPVAPQPGTRAGSESDTESDLDYGSGRRGGGAVPRPEGGGAMDGTEEKKA